METTSTRHNLIGQRVGGLDGFECFRQTGGVGIEWLGRWVITQIGIGTDIAGALQIGLQLIDGYTQLGVIHHTGFFVQVQVKFLDFVFGFGQAAIKQFAAASYFHASTAGAYKSQQRLWHQGGSLAYGYCLVVAGKVVDFEQYDTCVLLTDALVVAVFHFAGETDARHLVGKSVGTFYAAVVSALQFCVQRNAAYHINGFGILTLLYDSYCL